MQALARPSRNGNWLHFRDGKKLFDAIEPKKPAFTYGVHL